MDKSLEKDIKDLEKIKEDFKKPIQNEQDVIKLLNILIPSINDNSNKR